MRHLRIHENYYISKLKSSSITVLKGKVFHSTLKACSSEPHFFFFFFKTETFELGSSPLETRRSSELKQL